MACETSEYIYIILVDGHPSRDGYFCESDLAEANRVSAKYTQKHTVELKRIKPYERDLT